MDLLVVYSPCGGGHKAAANALVEAARARGLVSEAIDAFEFAPTWATEAYLAAHYNGQNRAPELYGAGYHATDARGGAWERLRLTVDRVLFRPLRDRVRAIQPRAIVCTHHLPLVVLGRERRKGRLSVPVTGVITDYAAHACWAERGVDRFCVPSLHAYGDLVRHRVDPSRIATTGIPVRAAFERIAPIRAPMRGEKLRVLVTSGGFGVGPIEQIVRSFAGHGEVDLTVVCGAAKDVEARVREIAESARVIGFEKEMAARVEEAHVVVGKAGGLTVSETLTAGRPLIIVGAIPGNEKLNEHFVAGGGAGIAARPSDAAAAALWLRDENLLERMGARGRLLVMTHAADRVLAESVSRDPTRIAALSA